MSYSAELQVLSISQAADIITGDPLYQVAFGKMGKPAAAFQSSTPMNKIASNLLVVFAPLEGECPYKAGSKWRLNVSDDGELTLQRKGKKR